MSVATIILIIVLVLVVVFAIVTYNGLVRRKNETEEAYRQIDVQLKRRYDLIPNLLEGVKKYFRQEQEVLTQVTQARSRAMQPQGVGEQAQSEARLSGAIGNLSAVAAGRPGPRVPRPARAPGRRGAWGSRPSRRRASPAPSAISSLWPRATPSFAPTGCSWTSRKSSPRRRTRSPSPGSTTTTPWAPTTPRFRASRRSSSPGRWASRRRSTSRRKGPSGSP